MPAAASHNRSSHTQTTTSHPRKTRTVRRRGRGRSDFGSDDEFVREVGTDSESDVDDDHSSADSSTDSDTEPASEESAAHSHVLTPNTTQSSADVPSLNGSASKPTQVVDASHAPFFSEAGNWSEMVAEENAHGPAELPVIEFADFTGSSMDQRSKTAPQRKPSKPSKRPPVKRAASAPTVDRPAAHSAPTAEQLEDPLPESTSDQPVASTSRQSSQTGFRRPPGQSARQAYQQRLESDPSYVPTVGEFWGHDDRLLDKDLRSLSGWWRGRWQGRGRGRGFIRGRGRGGSFAGPAPALRGTQSEDGLATQERLPVELPPVEQPWTHDGFEEMKKRDEKRRGGAQQQPTARPTRGFAPLRGRGGFVAGRGRGGTARGGVHFQPSRSTAAAAAASLPGKIWYAMKPEYPWTKHLETSLFHDSGPKPRPGTSPTYRVKFPNAEAQVVRGSMQAAAHSKPLPTSPEPQGSEDGEKNFVVRLPKWSAKDKVVQSGPVSAVTTEQPRLEDVFTVRPELVPTRTPIVDIKLPSVSATVQLPSEVTSTAGPSAQQAESLAAFPSPALPPVQEHPTQSASAVVDAVLHGHQDTAAPTLLKADTPHAPEPQEVPAGRRTLPPVPPLQTVFTPPQSSPPYSSPYGYGSPLPPGIAISQHGMAYEVATGRPVYLSAPIYTPRPLAHGMMTPPGVPYVAGHMHHHPTGSPDFLSAPHTPPLNGFIDPTTGSPMFAFPRQSSRIEIRAPAQLEPKTIKSQRRPSSLRTSAAAVEPSPSSSPANEAQLAAPRTEHYSSHTASDVQGGTTSEQQIDPSVYNYTAYPQTYYYPDQYGYSQYYDMSQAPRYEVYQADPHASQAVYY